MAKVSRMSKYKDLREGIKTDVQPTVQSTNETVKEFNSLSDNDFIREFPKIEEEESLQSATLTSPNQEDTFVEAVTLDKLNAQVDEELQRALTRVRQDAGHDDFNTRMDILNRIRQSQLDVKVEEPIQPVLVEDETIEEVKEEPKFGFFNREDTEELDEEFEEVADDFEEDDDDESDTKKHRFGFFKKDSNDDEDEEYDEDDDLDDDEDEEVEHSKFVKILNGIIVVLVLILIGLLGYFAKEFFF